MIKIFEQFNEPEIDETYWDNGQKKSEYWYLNGRYHREGGPAYQLWYENGQKMAEYWYLNGKYHREDGPAYQDWYENGQKCREYWYLNGRYHREDGYAVQGWDINGQKQIDEWLCLNGKSYLMEEWVEWVEDLKKIGSPHYEEQRMLLDMEKYNL